MAWASADWPLVGRDDELELIDGHLGAPGGRRSTAAAAVVAGTVGVGKTRLMTALLARQADRGRRTVVVRATRSTASVPFGAFVRWIPDRLGGTSDRSAVLQATAEAVVEGPGPPLVAVDDAQFLDEGSAALVLYLAQHADVGLVVTVRTGEPCPDAVVALWKESLAVRLDLAALAETEAVVLLEHALDGRVATATHRRIWDLTRGNPLYLREVVDAARRQGVLAVGETPGGGDREWRWDGRFEGSTRLVELIAGRIGSPGSERRRVLELVALGEPLPTEILTRLAPPGVLTEPAVPELLAGGSTADGSTVRLAHPLYSEVLRSQVPLLTLRHRRGELADAALAVGHHRRDPVRVAAWLLDSDRPGADPDLLLEASRRAQIIDHYELGARLAAAAEDAGAGWQATIWRAEALGALGRHEEADARLSGLSGPRNPPEARAEAARVRATHLFWHRGDGAARARAVVEEAAEVVPGPSRAGLWAYASRLALYGLDLPDAVRLGSRAVAAAEALPDRLHGVTTAGMAAALMGRTRAALATVEAVLPHVTAVIETDPVPAGTAAFTYSTAMAPDGRIDEAVAFFEMVNEQDVVRMGGPYRALPVLWLARAYLDQGRVRTAARLAREALTMLGDENHFGRGDWPAVTWATAAAQAGDEAGARRAVAWLEAHGMADVKAVGLYGDLARAWISAGAGQVSAARELAGAVGDRAAAAGARLVEMVALVDVVRFGGAADVADRMAALAPEVEGPYAPAAAAFARAAADGDGDALDVVAATFGGFGARLHAAEAAVLAARAHGEAGLHRRRAASLRTARALAARCEGAATPVLVRLDQQPGAERLTAREREVAELAGSGMANREIAAALGLSVRTVNSHLNHTYTKLGINDRAALAAVLGRRQIRP